MAAAKFFKVHGEDSNEFYKLSEKIQNMIKKYLIFIILAYLHLKHLIFLFVVLFQDVIVAKEKYLALV
jgi:hypothetical protein